MHNSLKKAQKLIFILCSTLLVAQLSTLFTRASSDTEVTLNALDNKSLREKKEAKVGIFGEKSLEKLKEELWENIVATTDNASLAYLLAMKNAQKDNNSPYAQAKIELTKIENQYNNAKEGSDIQLKLGAQKRTLEDEILAIKINNGLINLYITDFLTMVNKDSEHNKKSEKFRSQLDGMINKQLLEADQQIMREFLAEHRKKADLGKMWAGTIGDAQRFINNWKNIFNEADPVGRFKNFTKSLNDASRTVYHVAWTIQIAAFTITCYFLFLLVERIRPIFETIWHIIFASSTSSDTQEKTTKATSKKGSPSKDKSAKTPSVLAEHTKPIKKQKKTTPKHTKHQNVKTQNIADPFCTSSTVEFSALSIFAYPIFSTQ